MLHAAGGRRPAWAAGAFAQDRGLRPARPLSSGARQVDRGADPRWTLSPSFEHGLFGKPVPTFPDHALNPYNLLCSGTVLSTGLCPRHALRMQNAGESSHLATLRD